MRASGGGVLLVSHELDEVLALSDRVLVLMGGRIVGELNRAEADRGSIAELMTMGRRVDRSLRSPATQAVADRSFAGAHSLAVVRSAPVTAAVVTVRGAPATRCDGQRLCRSPRRSPSGAWWWPGPGLACRVLPAPGPGGVLRHRSPRRHAASATPLIITGMATLIAFKAGVFNIGVEGSFIAGVFTAAVVGAKLDLPGPIQIVLAIAAASAAGAVSMGRGGSRPASGSTRSSSR